MSTRINENELESLAPESLEALREAIDAGIAREMDGLCVMCRVRFEVQERKFAALQELLDLQLKEAYARREVDMGKQRLRRVEELYAQAEAESPSQPIGLQEEKT